VIVRLPSHFLTQASGGLDRSRSNLNVAYTSRLVHSLDLDRRAALEPAGQKERPHRTLAFRFDDAAILEGKGAGQSDGGR
jgi:hypothetical protein